MDWKAALILSAGVITAAFIYTSNQPSQASMTGGGDAVAGDGIFFAHVRDGKMRLCRSDNSDGGSLTTEIICGAWDAENPFGRPMIKQRK